MPRVGQATTRAIHNASVRTLFETLKALRPRITGAAAMDFRRFHLSLRDVAKKNPRALSSLLRSPSVSAPIRCLRDGLGDHTSLSSELIHQSFYHFALAGVLDETIKTNTVGRPLMSPVFGQSSAPTRIYHSEMSTSDAGFSLVCEDERRRVFLATAYDNNPLALDEAHPEKSGNALNLGGRDASEWQASLASAFSMLKDHLPLMWDEAMELVRQIVPVGYFPESHLSATYQQCIGTLYISLHDNPLTMVEALVHELSHTKLNALRDIDPLLENDPSELYTSPVRPDPRPIMGVLLAAHAFVPVAYLMNKMRQSDHPMSRSPHFERRFAEVLQKNGDAVELLSKQARPTVVGQGILSELEALHGELSATS